MALSNWDTLAFDDIGKPGNGVITGKRGYTAKIYKNWLSIVCNSGDVHVAQIFDGTVNIRGFEIQAKRGVLQNSIFVYVKWSSYKKKETKVYRMAGIGCYGFMSELEVLQKTLPKDYATVTDFIKENDCKIDDILEMTETNKDGHYLLLVVFNKNNEKVKDFKFKFKEPSLEDMWTGVREDTVNEFYAWLSETDKEYAAMIDITAGKRFNQGDAFFARHFNQGVPTTQIGGKSTPMISKMIDRMNHGEKNNKGG